MSNRGQVFKRGLTHSFYFSYTHNGKRKQVSKGGFKTQLLAQQALTKALSEIDGGRLVGADKQTVENFLRGWVKNYERSQTVKASTVETTKIHIEKYLVPGLGAVRLSALKVETIETFIGDLLSQGRINENSKKPKGLSPKTVRNIFGTF
jgi:hypothetical protein